MKIKKSPKICQILKKYIKYICNIIYIFIKNKMRKEVKEKLVGKQDKGQFVKDLIAYVVVVYVATLGFLLVDANVKLSNAQADLISNNIVTSYNMN